MISIQPGAIINFTNELKGSYILFIRINQIIPVIIRNKIVQLKSGYYLYVGSAFGAGGLSSRLHRHIRKIKKKHWHIDQITMSQYSSVEGIGISIDKRSECEISHVFSRMESIIPIKGFGNSDCDTCKSHFFKIAE